MQGNTTEIDERNLLRLDALLSHGYGLSPQLVMLAEDYEYELVKGYVRDFPEYVGQTQIPIKPGFKAIFDSDSSSTEKAEGEETENACEFGKRGWKCSSRARSRSMPSVSNPARRSLSSTRQRRARPTIRAAPVR